MGRLVKVTSLNRNTGGNPRFVACVYCAMAILALIAGLVVRAWSGWLGLPAETASSVSTGFLVVALFNLLALFALEFLNKILGNDGR